MVLCRRFMGSSSCLVAVLSRECNQLWVITLAGEILSELGHSIGKEQTKTATELAYVEVISYNRKNLEREFQNENRQQSRSKRREEEI